MVLGREFHDSRIMNYVVRMVTPMKREFGCVLDVSQFLNSRPYAIEVIQQALQSRDERLREYAVYLESKMFGPRASDLAGVATPSSGTASPMQAATPHAAEASLRDEAALRAMMLAKYKSGLR
jgi:hypothetical protein